MALWSTVLQPPAYRDGRANEDVTGDIRVGDLNWRAVVAERC